VRKVCSGGVAVFVDEAAEAVAALQLEWAGGDGILASDGSRRHELQRAVWPVRVVVLGVLAKHAIEMAAIEDEES
jgi:hypothetical protein